MTAEAWAELTERVAKETRQGGFAAANAMAEHLKGLFGGCVAGIVFYGSCLRAGEDADKILDYYVIVDDYRAAYGLRLKALGNWLLPPNVFYGECDFEGRKVRAKYAIMSTPAFSRAAAPRRFECSVWARFAQPSAILFARDEEAREAMTAALTQSVVTLVSTVVPLLPWRFSARDLWVRAFSETYRAELRSEGAGKAEEIYRLNRDRYDALALPALQASGLADEDATSGMFRHRVRPGAKRRAAIAWWWRRPVGKTLNVLRLMKAVFTFAGGIDYIAWKIARHSGVKIEITPWQRRHPLLAGLTLFWRLRRRGAFR